jgi:tetratricopeptide (TPR) repeat protein
VRALGLTALLATATEASALQAQQAPNAPPGPTNAQAKAPPTSGRWQDVYTAAVRSIQQGNWQAAVTGMRAALNLRAQQGRRVVFQGSLVDAYIPDYYLGVAYYNLRDYAQADQYFDRARQANLVIAADAQYREFQSQSSSAKFEATLARAQEAVKTGDSAAAAGLADAAAGLGGDATRVAAVRVQIDQLAKANTPAQGPVNPAPPTQTATNTPAPGPAPGAPLNPTQTPAQTAANPNLSRPTAATPAPATAATKAPGPAPRQTPYVPPRAAAAATRAIGPAAERLAFEAFYAGRYADALASLTAITAPTAGDNVLYSRRAVFYLACSRAALVITGDLPRTDLDAAKRDLAAAGGPIGLSADLKYVSPRVLAALGVRP